MAPLCWELTAALPLGLPVAQAGPLLHGRGMLYDPRSEPVRSAEIA